MILAETLECTVPSTNAVKDSVIYCVTGATNWPDVWSALGAWAGAIATTAAVIVALYQSKKAADAAKRAEELSQKQFDESIQLPALHAYVRAWREVADPDVTSAETPFQRLVSANLASTTWRDSNRKNLDNFEYIQNLQVEITRCLRHMEPAYFVISDSDWKRSGIKLAIHSLTNVASSWQSATPSERSAINASAEETRLRLGHQYSKFVDEVNASLREPTS